MYDLMMVSGLWPSEVLWLFLRLFKLFASENTRKKSGTLYMAVCHPLEFCIFEFRCIDLLVRRGLGNKNIWS